MYNAYERSSHRSSKSDFPWKWVGGVGLIIVCLFVIKMFSGNGEETSDTYLTVTPGEQSAVYISMSNVSKTRISSPEKLYATDKSVSVESGYAKGQNAELKIDIDSSSEASYLGSSATGNSLSVSKGRLWVEPSVKPTEVVLKNLSVKAPAGSVFLVEQNGPFSSAYALTGDIEIETKAGTTTLVGGKMIKLLASDLLSSGASLDSWMEDIDGGITEIGIMKRNGGAELLKNILLTTSGATTQTGSLSGGTLTSGQTIEIIEPKSNAMIKTSPITIMGNLLSKEVKRVTINNKEATVSPVNENFVYQGFEVQGDVVDIVYKSYDANNILLESGVITVFGTKNSTTSSQLVPETFPLSSKDFRITSPSPNPYKTTETFVKVQGVVPKNTVEYIMVNDYRLQKFIPNSTSWYYFANMKNDTMEEGINMYTIKFFEKSGKLIGTQVFTLIKESTNGTTSGEALQ